MNIEKVMKKILFTLFPCLVLAACSQESSSDLAAMGSGEEICLTGKIDGIVEADTRTAINAGYNGSLNVKFARLDMNPSTGAWTNYASSPTLIAATYNNGNINFGTPQYYLVCAPGANKKSSKLVAWHPADVVPASGALDFSSKLNGCTDIMLTPEQTGNDRTAGDKFKPFTFNHLLTQINVTVKCSDTNAAGLWGSVSRIEVLARNTCKVTLPAALDYGSATVYTDLRATGSDNAMTAGKVIPATTAGSTPCGYCLFPPTSGKTLTLRVTTTLGNVRTVEITSPDATFVAGKNYAVTLTFSSTTITPSATIGAWADGGSAHGNFKV